MARRRGREKRLQYLVYEYSYRSLYYIDVGTRSITNKQPPSPAVLFLSQPTKEFNRETERQKKAVYDWIPNDRFSLK